MLEPGVPDAPGRPRRVRRIALVALVVLLVAIAAGSGVLVGRGTAPGPTLVVLPGPLSQERPGAEQLAESGSSTILDVAIPARPAALPAVFSASPDLSDTATTATGYQLARDGLDGAGLAAGLAFVFGVDGTPETTDTGWRVGPGDDSGPTLTVRNDAALTWALSDPQALAASRAGVYVNPARAKAIASALLSTIGVDVSSVDWQEDRFDDRVTVTAWQLVEGRRSTMAWRISVGKDESIVSASGFAADVVAVPGYSVIGAATAVRRAGLATWSFLGPTPLDGTDASATGPSIPDPAPTGPSGRPALAVQVSGIVITDAVLGLAQFRQPDGGVLILPAYQLTGDDGSRWTLIAVSGDYVDFVDRPYPTASASAS